MRFDWFILTLLVLIASLVGLPGCDRSSPEDATRVTQIVFLDQEEICPIIKKQINGVWDNVQTVAAPRNIKVTRVYRDTQGSLARKYTEFKPMAVPPGLYFVSGTGEVIDMLQGDKSVEDITAVIEKHESAPAASLAPSH